MPPEPQNPIPPENSIPASPQEPTADAPIPTSTSEQVEVPPEAPETSTEARSAVPVNNPSDAEAVAGKDNSANEPLSPAPEPEITAEPNNPNVIIEKRGNDVTITEVIQPTNNMQGLALHVTDGSTCHIDILFRNEDLDF